MMKRFRVSTAGASELQLARGERPLLVVAHPGHELRLFGWLCDARPDVLVFTDGSGHSSRSRIEATDRILRATGARAGSIFGDYTDRELYVAMLEGDAAPFIEMTASVVNVLRRGQYRTVVADPLEGYNPTHDLCRVIVNTAIRCVSRACGSAIRNYDYALTGMSDVRGSPASIVMRLPAKVRERKIAAAIGYSELFAEVAVAVEREGRRAYDEEVLRKIAPDGSDQVAYRTAPFYETYGEQQCAAGRYADVIRHAEHFLPIAWAVMESIEPAAGSAQRAGVRSSA